MTNIPVGGIKEIIQILPPKGSHYPYRQKVLKEAIKNHPEMPALPFLLHIVTAQESAFQQLAHADSAPKEKISQEATPPFIAITNSTLSQFQLALQMICQKLTALLESEIKAEINKEIDEKTHGKTDEKGHPYHNILMIIASLNTRSQDQEAIKQILQQLLTLTLDKIPAEEHIFLIAALQTTLHHAATQLEIDKNYQLKERDLCPCCKMPAISSVLDNSEDGLRYLYCSFCETKWHVVRGQCTECLSNKSLYQQRIEGDKSPIYAEVCDECQTYLKVTDRTKTLLADPFIEDLLTLPLSIRLTEENYKTFGVNPYLL